MSDLSKEEMNQAIARACGWQVLAEHCLEDASKPCGLNPGSGKWETIPDYCESLDAMHEAETLLSEQQRNVYLMAINGRYMGGAYGTGPSFHDWWKTTHASAHQRARAFLATIAQDTK